MDPGSLIALITLIVTVLVTATAAIRYLIEISLKIQQGSLLTHQAIEKLTAQMMHNDKDIHRETEDLRERIRHLEDRVEKQAEDLLYMKHVIEKLTPGKFNRKHDLTS